MMTPFGSEGGLQKIWSCKTSGIADKPEIGTGTVYTYMRIYNYYVCNCPKTQHHCHSPSCSVSTVSSVLYGPVPLSLTAATCTE